MHVLSTKDRRFHCNGLSRSLLMQSLDIILPCVSHTNVWFWSSMSIIILTWRVIQISGTLCHKGAVLSTASWFLVYNKASCAKRNCLLWMLLFRFWKAKRASTPFYWSSYCSNDDGSLAMKMIWEARVRKEMRHCSMYIVGGVIHLLSIGIIFHKYTIAWCFRIQHKAKVSLTLITAQSSHWQIDLIDHPDKLTLRGIMMDTVIRPDTKVPLHSPKTHVYRHGAVCMSPLGLKIQISRPYTCFIWRFRFVRI